MCVLCSTYFYTTVIFKCYKITACTKFSVQMFGNCISMKSNQSYRDRWKWYTIPYHALHHFSSVRRLECTVCKQELLLTSANKQFWLMSFLIPMTQMEDCRNSVLTTQPNIHQSTALTTERLSTHFTITTVLHFVAWWLSGWDAGLAINRSRVRFPASPLSSATLGKLLTHMCLCHQAV